ncbi:MAG: hypothetical protein ACREQ5_01610 [Candidatus Dormibacteria bacterium]
MDRPISAEARLAQYDPYAYQGQREAQARPVERYDDYPVEQYRQPHYETRYHPRERTQVVAICAAVFIFLTFVGLLLLFWVTAPIVTYSEPSCVVFC